VILSVLSKNKFIQIQMAVVGAVFCTSALSATEQEPAARKVNCENIFQAPEHGKSFYEDNPTYKDPYDDTGAWTFVHPKDRGLDTDILKEAVVSLGKTKRAFSAIVVKDGAVVLERYFNGSSKQDSNNIHSASKSIMSLLIGMAIEKGHIKSIDQPVLELLPNYTPTNDSKWLKKLSVYNLLTMSSGMKWRDSPVSGTEYDIQKKEDWVQEIIDLPMMRAPGKKFFYNTGLTHLMSAIISEATGKSACEFAHENLFGPLGITAEHWGRDPQGYYSGGYNLYMTPREMTKFGLLVLQSGRIPSGPIVSADWIKQSVSTHFRPYEDFGYGYNWWIMRVNGHVIPVAWGWGGQMIYVVPKLRSVVVITRNTADADLVEAEPLNHDFLKKFIESAEK